MKVHAVVKATEYDAPMNVVVATIPGDGSTNEEFHFTAHLFEGIAKQGANDNCGGPATQLEAGRAWIAMIKERPAAEAEADGALPVGARDQRHARVPAEAHPDLAASMPSRRSRPTWSAPTRRSTTTRCT